MLRLPKTNSDYHSLFKSNTLVTNQVNHVIEKHFVMFSFRPYSFQNHNVKIYQNRLFWPKGKVCEK